MSRFHLDLSKFKKHSEDENTTTLAHQDGHKIIVAHKALHPKMREQLAKLPKPEKAMMADGGEVADENKDIPYDKLIPEEKSQNRPYGTPDTVAPQAPVTINVQGGGTPPQVSAPTPQLAQPAPEQPKTSAPEQTIPGHNLQTPTPSEPDYMQGYQKQVQGLQQEAVAQAAMAKEQEMALKSQVMAQQNMQQQYQQHFDDLNKERQAFQDDIKNSHIDPQRYMGNKSTVGKVGTAIGLILGGIGGGLTGRGSDALAFLNSQIDRDIEAQKADLGKKENLLSANMRQFGNMRDATEMTRLMMGDMVNNQLKAAAAKAQGPQAQANALKMIGSLEQQAAPMAQQLATRRMLTSAQGAGEGGVGQLIQQDPAKFIPAVVPKEEQAAAFKEAQEAQNMAQAKNNILGAFKKLTEINTVGGHITSPVQTHRQVAAIKDPLVAGLSKATAGRFTEQDAGMLDSLFPKAGDSEATIAQKKDQIDKLVSEKMHFPVLSAYGLDPSKFASTSGSPEAALSPQQQSFVKWARQNPNDPKAALVLKKLGLQ